MDNIVHCAVPDTLSVISTQIWRIMKLSFIFIFVALMQVSASVVAQKVNLSERNTSLESVIEKLRLQTGYDFFYIEANLKNAKPVVVKLKSSSIEEALEKIFAGQPLSYEIKDRTVILKLKAPSLLERLTGFWTAIDVSGFVYDMEKNPLAGASIRVKNGQQVAVTDKLGGFMLKNIDEDAVVVISYLGFKPLEIKAGQISKGMRLVLMHSESKLDEIQVIGYGTTTQRTSTGNVSSIKAEDIEKQPVTNALQALQGRVPGVFITQANGLPGAGISVQIRGLGSLGGASRPLYIIDGVPFLSEPITSTISGVVALSAEGATSPMNLVNPSDIESIEILKDADATAIYGSRGANGVVLITTKKGKAGKTNFSVNASTGLSTVANLVELQNTEQYLALRRKGFANNPTAVPGAGDSDLSWDPAAYTNFPKLLLGNSAHANDITSNVSGGDARTNFYLSGTYHKETNIFPGNQGYSRGGGNLNINHSTIDQKFTLSLSAIYTADKNNITTTDLASYAYYLAPNFALYKPDGSLYWASGFNNPMGFLNQTNDARGSNFITNLNLKYNVLKGLDVKASIGYSKTDMKTKTVRPLSAINATSTTTSGSASESYIYVNNYIFEPQATYKRPIWKGNLEVLAGGTWQFKKANQPYNVSATDFLSDEFITNLSAANTRTFSSSSSEFKYVSVFGRLNYNIGNKYIANISYRRDGSSRFGPNKRFGNFGSVGAAWIFSEENFLKEKFKWLSFGKLRGSYGVIGSDDIGNFRYYDSYNTTSFVYNGLPGLQPSRLANDDFQWEETRKLEVGLELGFFKDKLSINASIYRNRTSNQLLLFAVSQQTGFSSYQSNLPALVQNSGLEIAVNSTNFERNGLIWTSSFNISKNRNKLVSYPGIENSSYFSRFQVGKPISTNYLYQYTGIDPVTGVPSFTDFNGDGIIGAGFAATSRGDQYDAGTSFPSFYGGLSNSVSYKGLRLDFTFQFVKQKGRSLAAYSFSPPGYPNNTALSVAEEYLALGSPDQLVTAVSNTVNGRSAYFGFMNYAASDATIIDASFIRMKNASLSYSLPKAWASKIKAKDIRIYLQGQNLFTITGYDGYDPESQGVGTPPLRTISAGLQCSF